MTESHSRTLPDPQLPADGTIEWSVHVTTDTGRALLSVHADRVLATASVGKLLLLIETAEQLTAGRIDATEVLSRTAEDAVADSGLWQALAVHQLPLLDVAALVGATSDNIATNVLLRRIGLPAVAGCAQRMGLQHTALHDRVRNARAPSDPPRLSSGCARELAVVMRSIARGDGLEAAVSEQVSRWLAFNCDLSMVAAPWGLDPLAHRDPDRGWTVLNKTGTDLGVRADVGAVRLDVKGSFRDVIYAVLANWPPGGPDRRDDVLSGMASVGRWLECLLRAETDEPDGGCVGTGPASAAP